MQRVHADDERGGRRQDLDQRNRKNGDEDVRIAEREKQRDQRHAAVRQPREWRRMEEETMLGQRRNEQLQHVVNSELLEEQRHADSGHGNRRVRRRIDKELVRGPCNINMHRLL